MNKKLIIVTVFFLIIIDAFSQKKGDDVIDTLFFHVETDILIKNNYENDLYYLIGNISKGIFAFKIIEKNVALEPRNVLYLKEYLQTTFNKSINILSYELTKELRKYKIFLVEKKCNKEIIMEVFPVSIEI